MKKLIFCCLCVLALMACTEKNSLSGRWAIEMEGSNDTAFILPNDTICSPELRFEYDTVYMDIKVDGKTVKSDFIGQYTTEENKLKIVNRMGEERLCVYRIVNDTMEVSYLTEPDKIIMRLHKIKED